MSDALRVAYTYDGSFAGFLTCLAESERYRECPEAFLSPGDGRISLFPERVVETDEDTARKVYQALKRDISPTAREWAAEGFLTCAGDRERMIWDFVRLGRAVGPGVTRWLADPRVAPLWKAVQFLRSEAHLLKGFTRFSDHHGVLAACIEPKNRVLPLLRGHFCARFNTESFLIFDETHREALFYQPGRWAIAPLEALELDEPGPEEREMRALWSAFYETVSIEGRYNPRLRMGNVPKRYWKEMTELKGHLADSP